jgi:type IV secretory pathway VirB3-like protein
LNELNPGLIADPLFVGATRPPMRWGVTYSALLFNMVFTLETFLLTKNLLLLLVCGPIHGVCMLLCARDARFFDLVLLWARTRLPAWFGIFAFGRQAALLSMVLICRIEAVADDPKPAPPKTLIRAGGKHSVHAPEPYGRVDDGRANPHGTWSTVLGTHSALSASVCLARQFQAAMTANSTTLHRAAQRAMAQCGESSRCPLDTDSSSPCGRSPEFEGRFPSTHRWPLIRKPSSRQVPEASLERDLDDQ